MSQIYFLFVILLLCVSTGTHAHNIYNLTFISSGCPNVPQELDLDTSGYSKYDCVIDGKYECGGFAGSPDTCSCEFNGKLIQASCSICYFVYTIEPNTTSSNELKLGPVTFLKPNLKWLSKLSAELQINYRMGISLDIWTPCYSRQCLVPFEYTIQSYIPIKLTKAQILSVFIPILGETVTAYKILVIANRVFKMASLILKIYECSTSLYDYLTLSSCGYITPQMIDNCVSDKTNQFLSNNLNLFNSIELEDYTADYNITNINPNFDYPVMSVYYENTDVDPLPGLLFSSIDYGKQLINGSNSSYQIWDSEITQNKTIMVVEVGSELDKFLGGSGKIITENDLALVFNLTEPNESFTIRLDYLYSYLIIVILFNIMI
jgi:hypothetical protein